METSLFYEEKYIQVINACLRLHNCIVDWEDDKEVTATITLEQMVFNDNYSRFLFLNPNIENYGVQGSDEEPQLPGRPTTNESYLCQAGINIHSGITSKVKENNYTRSKSNWYRDNNHFINT